jgi:cell pole-organizing protein PopZ
MSDEKSQEEPTMEEILASIRRIISENDDGEAKPADEEAKAEAPAPVTEPEAPEAKEEPAPEPAPEPEPEPEPEAAEEEILELTEVVEEETPPADNAGDGDDLVVEEAPSAPEPEPVPAPVARVPDSDALVADPIAAASTAALGVLAQSLNRDSGTVGNIALGPGNTLEDLVRDMLRPMLKEWLDQNLAQLVERLVKKEIERMVRRAEDN